MKVATLFSVLTLLCALNCDSAEARYFRPVHVYNADEVGRQQRANMAERTHQQKELMQATRLYNERERLSAASTVKNYKVKATNKRVRMRNSALANRQNRNAYNY